MKLSKYADRLVGQPMFKISEKVNAWNSNFSQFEIGDPDFQTPKAIKDATITAILQGNTHYTKSSGCDELKESIIRFNHLHGDITPEFNQVVIAPGCNPLVYAVIRCIVDEGDAVAIPDPGFPTYRSVLDFLAIEAVSIPLLESNGFNPDPQDIENLPDNVRLVILNSPSNPTGAMLTEETANEISDICERKGIYLLSDEIYSLMSYGDKHYTPCYKDKCKNHTIMINGFSKAFAMSGFRLGYMIAPPPLAEKVSLLLQTIVSCTSHFVQLAGVEAYDRIPSDLKRNLSVLTDRRSVLVEGLNQIPGITCTMPQGAFYVFPNIKGTSLSSNEFTDLVFKRYVSLVSGADFGKYGEGYVRMAFTQSTVQARMGLHRIGKALLGNDKMFPITKQLGREI